jgi:ABC-type nitrate/sulfonate/bicarbonate transport system ATPase subunit
MSEVLLRFLDLGFSYPDGTEVLKSASLDLREGDFVCLLGPSGCGKSTLLRLAAGLLQPNEGVLHYRDRVCSGMDRRRILVYQEQDQLFPWKRIRSNLALPLMVGPEALNRKQAESRAMDALERVGLADKADVFPYQLSGGMKQRAVLARALALNAELLLLDEPFASLDAESRESLQNLLVQTWKESSVTILFVTHDIREAVRIAREIRFMPEKPGSGPFRQLIPEGSSPRDLEDPSVTGMVRQVKSIAQSSS